MKIGFMQGRLIDSENKNFIQYFPSKNWKKEIKLALLNGLSLIEWTANLENLKRNPVYNTRLLKDLILFKKKNNIIINSITCDFFMQKPFFNFSGKKMYFFLDILKKIIINSQKIGIKYIILPLVDNSSIKNIIQEKTLIKLLNNKNFLSNLDKESKILFETDFSPRKIIMFMKNFDKNKFGINYDTGNSSHMGYKISDEKIYFRYLNNVHIKDRVKVTGKSVRLGCGNTDFKSFFKILKKIKYKGNLILQTARAKNNNHINEININKRFIMNYI
jgi:L-ribulose-5-phosphate 3-epimerase